MSATIAEGFGYLARYFLEGEAPPLAWCPIEDIRFVDVMVWGNILIFIAYQVIPLGLVRLFRWLEPLVPHKRFILAFALFIGMCGISHLLMVWAMFSGHYQLLAMWCMATAIVSIWTAGEVWALGSALRHGSKGTS
jgi:hypothetical protein